MNHKTLKCFVHELLKLANIIINGNHPWDIHIHNEEFYNRVIHYGSLGLGESYIDKWWDCPNLDQFFERIVSADLESKITLNKWMLFKIALSKYMNLQTKKRSFDVGKKHYDLGNDLFAAMLDKNMNYTCGYWLNSNQLDAAQLDKLQLVCQKLFLQPGMHLLDVGCGFGSLARYAAEHYGVQVTGITISKEQYGYAKQNCAALPIDIRFQDYRDLNGTFDRIVSLGMFEHVGYKNYRHYMQIMHDCLKDDGLFLLHTIGNDTTHTTADEWTKKYIFPNGMLPSISQIGTAIEALFIMEDWHNFGADYDKTLMAWYNNFNQHWDTLKHKYDDRFYRMWSYYLLSCAGTFRARRMQLWQIVLSKQGLTGGYQAPQRIKN